MVLWYWTAREYERQGVIVMNASDRRKVVISADQPDVVDDGVGRCRLRFVGDLATRMAAVPSQPTD